MTCGELGLMALVAFALMLAEAPPTTGVRAARGRDVQDHRGHRCHHVRRVPGAAMTVARFGIDPTAASVGPVRLVR